MHTFLGDIVADIQSWMLAYYKKEYVSGANHPPLGYFVQVLRASAHPKLKPRPLMMLKISPDAKMELATPPGKVLRLQGSYYHEGVGTIEIEHTEDRATCRMKPSPHITIERHYSGGRAGNAAVKRETS